MARSDSEPIKWPEIILKPGFNAVPLPYFGNENPYLHELEPVDIDSAAKRIENFLMQIEQQGGMVLGVITQEVDFGEQPGLIDSRGDQQFLIVKK